MWGTGSSPNIVSSLPQSQQYQSPGSASTPHRRQCGGSRRSFRSRSITLLLEPFQQDHSDQRRGSHFLLLGLGFDTPERLVSQSNVSDPRINPWALHLYYPAAMDN